MRLIILFCVLGECVVDRRKLRELLSFVSFKKDWLCDDFCTDDQKQLICQYLEKMQEFEEERLKLEMWLKNSDESGDSGELVSVFFF